MDKIDRELRDKLRDVLAGGVSDEAMAAIKKATDQILYDIQGDIEYRLKDDLAPNLACWVAELAAKAVEQILEGNEDQMRRYLSCEKRGKDGQYIGWTGRSDSPYAGSHDFHSVIHGRLFEQGALALRKKIVDTHRDVLVSERILDLEDQVKSLVAQVNKKEQELERMRDRLRAENAY